jgi:hypothetical protein
MPNFYRRLTTALAQAQTENAAVAAEVAHGNLRRLQGLALLVVCINLLHVLAFSGAVADEAAQVGRWRQALVALHLSMAVAAAALGLLALWLHRRGPDAHPVWVRACGMAAFALALVFAALVVAVDQWVTPNITPFLIACALLGVTLLQRPLVAAALYALAFAVFYVALGQTQADATLLLSNRVNGLTAAVLAWALATLSWRKTTLNLLLTRELSQRNASMQSQQIDLLRMATRDGLTGLVNRAEVERLGRLEVERARRYGLDVALLLIDLDHFKRVNDEWGHPAGDAVLAQVAATLHQHVRASEEVDAAHHLLHRHRLGDSCGLAPLAPLAARCRGTCGSWCSCTICATRGTSACSTWPVMPSRVAMRTGLKMQACAIMSAASSGASVGTLL